MTNDSVMKTSFIEDYLQDPSAAIASAVVILSHVRFDKIDDDDIYNQISSPEFHLYEEILGVDTAVL